MPQVSLSVLSSGGLDPRVFPRTTDRSVVRRREPIGSGAFTLIGSGWEMFVHEFQQPGSSVRSGQRAPGEPPRSPLEHPYLLVPVETFAGCMNVCAREHDLIVIGFCNGEGLERIGALSPWIREKTVLTYGRITPADARQAQRLGVLDTVNRRGLGDWLVDRAKALGDERRSPPVVVEEVLASMSA